MKYMGVNELRRSYLEFFESKNHLKMNSFSLIPHNDVKVDNIKKANFTILKCDLTNTNQINSMIKDVISKYKKRDYWDGERRSVVYRTSAKIKRKILQRLEPSC